MEQISGGGSLDRAAKEERWEQHCRWIEMESIRNKNGDRSAFYAAHPEKYAEDLERATNCLAILNENVDDL